LVQARALHPVSEVFEFVFLGSRALKSYNRVCKLRERGRRSEVNESPNGVSQVPSPWNGGLAPLIESRGQVTYGERGSLD